jgi:molybdopterin synthase sulfur carrier subunit
VDGPPTREAAPDVASTDLTVRFWAAARAAAGTDTVVVAAGSLVDVLDDLTTKYPDLSALLPRCSLLLDGVAVGRDAVYSTSAAVGATLEILPPFAGG